MSILLAIIALGVLILVHELGHFIAAKLCGVYVERFSIGFGKPLWKVKKGETEYCLSAVPLGGYVKLHRMLEEEDVIEGKESAAFFNKSYPKKIFIITAGVLFNIIFAVLLLSFVFMAGYRAYSPVVGEVEEGRSAYISGFESGDRIVSADGKDIRAWEEFSSLLDSSEGSVSVVIERNLARRERMELFITADKVDYTMPNGETILIADPGMSVWLEPVVGGLSTGFPAEKAGIKKGDRFVSINGIAMGQWQDVGRVIRDRAELETNVIIERSGERLDFVITPQKSPDAEGVGLIGVMPPAGDVVLREDMLTSLALGVDRTWAVTKAIGHGLKQLVTGEVSRESLGGPILIVQEGAKSAESGYERYLAFMALISINLAILNILPVPVLDGGYVVMFTYEAVFRRKMSPNARMRGQQVGIMLLALLMVFAFYNDILRFFK